MQLDKLKDHQRDPAIHLRDCLRQHQGVLDLSGMGTGKTYVAAAVLNDLRLPALVVPPKVAITAWHRAAAHFDDALSVVNYEKLRTGRTPYGWWDNNPPVGWEREEYFVCQCCQRQVDLDNYFPCYCHPIGAHCLITKKRKWVYGDFHFHPAVKAVVFDEGHRCAGADSLNAKMLMAAKRDGKKLMVLTATAALGPLHMQALGYAFDLHQGGGDFYRWARRYGCKNDRQFGGFVWLQTPEVQAQTMKAIGEQLIPKFGVRMRVEDIPGFPECDIQAELYDLDQSDAIDQLYAEMADAIEVLSKRSEKDVCGDHPLTKMLRARQNLELLKVPVAVELARDYQAKDYSVVIGVNFQQTLDELRRRLGWSCFIDGTPAGVRLRQQNIDNFQINKERGMVMNIKAGGISVSLQDLYGDAPRVGLAFPSTSAIDMIQFFGRLPREGAKTKSHYRLILAARTVEQQIFKKFNVKRNNLQALNDRDLVPDMIPIGNFYSGQAA